MTPHPTQVFDAFKYCPFGDLKVVFLSVNSYDDGGDGLALSYSKDKLTNRKESNLFFDAMEKDLDQLYLDRDYDMRKLARHGILFLNCDLTGLKGGFQKHLFLWKPFINYLIDYLTEETACIFVLMGVAAQKYQPVIAKAQNIVYCLEHPLNAVKQIRAWDHQNVFKKLDVDTEIIFDTKINWFI